MNTKLNDIKDFFLNTNKLIKYGNIALQIVLILIAIKAITHFGSLIINKFFEKQKSSRFGFNEKKSDTLSELLKSVLKYTAYIIGILSILDAIGFNTRTLLVGAGLGGLAIGFGAQSLVKDIISGFFIIFEDQFSVGEFITIEQMSGIVEAVGLRITKLKDFTGDLHIIPNGSIVRVTNHSRDNSRALVEVQVEYQSNIDKVLEILDNISMGIRKDNENIVEGPTVLGVTELADSGVKIKVVARTKPMKQWEVEMELRKRIKEIFEKENIGIPYPTSLIITKSGNNDKE